jgi:hypothetical protein
MICKTVSAEYQNTRTKSQNCWSEYSASVRAEGLPGKEIRGRDVKKGKGR